MERGHEVDVICSFDQWVDKIRTLGCEVHEARVPRFIDPVGDLRYLFELISIFANRKYDLVHTFTIKPNLYATLLARLFRVPRRVCLVEGLGFAYANDGIKGAAMKKLVELIYRVVYLNSDGIWFINHDDIRDLLDAGSIAEDKVFYTRSIGVNSSEYNPDDVSEECVRQIRREFGVREGQQIFTLVGRMNWSKGIREFVEAAKVVQRSRQDIVFLIVGEITQGSPESIDVNYFKSINNDQIYWLDYRDDVVELMTASDAIVLPSYYREGVPRALLEAMSMGRPIITTDSPGCREVIRDGVNGYIVQPRDVDSLADAMLRMAEDPKRRQSFGEQGKKWVDEELEEALIVKSVLGGLYGV